MNNTKKITLNNIAYVIGFNRLSVFVLEYDNDTDSFLCLFPYSTREWVKSSELTSKVHP